VNVTIVDYGMGNLSSVAKAFETLGVDVVVSSKPDAIASAERIVLPGVGAFGEGMENLRRFGLIGPLEEAVRVKRRPFLGICLGMQLLAREGFEHGHHEGLGWVAGAVKPFEVDGARFKSIHIGWNHVVPRWQEPFFTGLENSQTFYFVHGYHLICETPQTIYATSRYGQPFVSSICQDNIFGVQFHPEKSQEAGLALLHNFLRWDPTTPVAGRSLEGREDGVVPPNVRLIPTLSLWRGRLVKTVKFAIVHAGLRRDVGDPVKAPMVYDAQLADELIYLDIRASLEGRDSTQVRHIVSEVAGQIFMPLTAGGGITTLHEIRALLQAGADRVAINSAAVEQPSFITEAAETFGRQCLVVSIDAKLVGPGRYEVFTHSGTKATGLDPVRWARQAAEAGAGELLLTSIDRDGTMVGYDLSLIRAVSGAVNIPVIASGGAGTLHDLAQGVAEGRASAIAAASLFHFRDLSPIKAKAFLRRAGLPIRT